MPGIQLQASQRYELEHDFLCRSGVSGFDAAILFSDILVVPHALGQRVTCEQGEGPRLDALQDPAALDGLGRERTGRDLPEHERIGILNRSHYEEARSPAC